MVCAVGLLCVCDPTEGEWECGGLAPPASGMRVGGDAVEATPRNREIFADGREIRRLQLIAIDETA